MKRIIVAIDGHSSCGKSTMAKRLAKEVTILVHSDIYKCTEVDYVSYCTCKLHSLF